jgi:Fe-S-cluster containining protein
MVFDEDDIRWIEYHGIKVVDKNGKQWIKIPNQCDKLVDNKCSIHDNRPDNCKIFICE